MQSVLVFFLPQKSQPGEMQTQISAFKTRKLRKSGRKIIKGLPFKEFSKFFFQKKVEELQVQGKHGLNLFPVHSCQLSLLPTTQEIQLQRRTQGVAHSVDGGL